MLMHYSLLFSPFLQSEAFIFNLFTDINECVADVCDQTCVNTDGSFLCTCKSGFILEDKCRGVTHSSAHSD